MTSAASPACRSPLSSGCTPGRPSGWGTWLPSASRPRARCGRGPPVAISGCGPWARLALWEGLSSRCAGSCAKPTASGHTTRLSASLPATPQARQCGVNPLGGCCCGMPCPAPSWASSTGEAGSPARRQQTCRPGRAIRQQNTAWTPVRWAAGGCSSCWMWAALARVLAGALGLHLPADASVGGQHSCCCCCSWWDLSA